MTSSASIILGLQPTTWPNHDVIGGDDNHGHTQGNMEHGMQAMISTAKQMHWATSSVVAPIFIILGLVGNAFSVIVWNQNSMRGSTGRYLTALAIADSGVLIWFFLCDSLPMIEPDVYNNVPYAIFFTYLGYPFFFLFVVCSIWIMVGVTVDRFFMVCLITKAKEFCNEKRANLSLALIVGLCFIVNLPHFWSFQVNMNPSENNTLPALSKTEFETSQAGLDYEFWVHCIFLVLVPWFTIFSLNLFIIGKISKTNKRMSERKSIKAVEKSRRSENQITRVLLFVTFTFLLLIGFQCISQCLYMLMPEQFDKDIIDEAFAIAKLGIVINSSTNFLLYCISGRRFRKEFYIVIGLAARERGMSSYADSRSTGASGTSTTGI